MSLKDNHLFRGLTGEEISKILPMIRIQTIRKGSVIIEEGQTDRILYVLISGQVHVVKITPDKKERLIAVRNEGDFFGEMALLEDAPRSARIVAVEPCEVGLIDDTAFTRMMDLEPRVAVNLLKTISAKLRQTSDQIIEQFTRREAEQKKQIDRLHQLVEICKAITANFDKNHLMTLIPASIRQQISCDAVYFILMNDPSGQLVVSENGKEGVRVIAAGHNPFSAVAEKIMDFCDFSPFQERNDPESEFLWNHSGRLLLVPLSGFEHSDGWIVLKKSVRDAWDENDIAYLETLASYVVVALQNIRLSAQIVVSEKLSAVGRASSSIIHDFKNLLSVVHIYAQMIMKSKGPEDTKDLVEKILQSSNMMITMSKEILTFARGEIALNRADIAVDHMVRGVLSLIEHELKRRSIELALDIPSEHRYAFDAEKMSRAIYNLLKNAAESIDKPGGIIRLTSLKSDKELCLTISDNGKGIPEAVLQTMFTPFVTTKTEGTGLGMLIVKNIVEAHGGQIDLDSAEGKGTDVLLTFPLKK